MIKILLLSLIFLYFSINSLSTNVVYEVPNLTYHYYISIVLVV